METLRNKHKLLGIVKTSKQFKKYCIGEKKPIVLSRRYHASVNHWRLDVTNKAIIRGTAEWIEKQQGKKLEAAGEH